MQERTQYNVSEQWWEYKSQGILWECVMDSMNNEMTSKDPVVLWEMEHPVVFTMEEISMKDIFSKSPTYHTEHQNCKGCH